MAEGEKTTGQPTDAIGSAAMAAGNPMLPIVETIDDDMGKKENYSPQKPKDESLSFFDRFFLRRMETRALAEKEEQKLAKERKDALEKTRGGKHEYFEKMDYLNREKYLRAKAIIWQWRIQNYVYPVLGAGCFLGIIAMFAFGGFLGLLIALVCGILAASSFSCASKLKDNAATHQNNMYRLGGVNHNDQGGELLEAKRDFDTHNAIKKSHFDIKRDAENIEKSLGFLTEKCKQVHGGISSSEAGKLAKEAEKIVSNAQEILAEMKAAFSTMQTNVKDRPNQEEKKWENEAKINVEKTEKKMDALRVAYTEYKKKLENRTSEESLAEQLEMPILPTKPPERQI